MSARLLFSYMPCGKHWWCKTDTVFSSCVKHGSASPDRLAEAHTCSNQVWLKELETLVSLKKQRKPQDTLHFSLSGF